MARAKTKTAKKTGRTTHAARRTEGESGLTKAEAKKALAAATLAIKSLKRQADKNFWQIGRKLNAIAELGLYTAAGDGSVGDYAESSLGLSRATAYAYMRVAAAFGEEIATTFGAAKLDRGLAYIAATPEDETARDVPKLKVRVPDAHGVVHEKRFADVSTRELAAAAIHERAEHPPKRGKRKLAVTVTAAVKRKVARANTSLDRAVGKSNAAGADVAVRTRDGEVLIDIRGVPLGTLAKALAAVGKAFR